jgi:hypothetical protein
MFPQQITTKVARILPIYLQLLANGKMSLQLSKFLLCPFFFEKGNPLTLVHS